MQLIIIQRVLLLTLLVTAILASPLSTMQSAKKNKKAPAAPRGSLHIDIRSDDRDHSKYHPENSTPHLLHMRGGASKPTGFLSSMPLYGVKALMQTMLTSINIACFAIPLYCESVVGNSKIMSFANAFAAGIFFMLAMGNMVPQSVDILESIGKDKHLAFYMTLVGYLIVFFIEKVAFGVHEKHDKEADAAASSKGAIVLLLAMSIHSLMETAALGSKHILLFLAINLV